MVITVLEARVASENQHKLIAAYRSSIKNLDPGIVETFLAAGTEDRTLWWILTVWQDREALESMRNSGTPPRGILITGRRGPCALVTFCSIGRRTWVTSSARLQHPSRSMRV